MKKIYSFAFLVSLASVGAASDSDKYNDHLDIRKLVRSTDKIMLPTVMPVDEDQVLGYEDDRNPFEDTSVKNQDAQL